MNTYFSSFFFFLIFEKIPEILMEFWLFHSLHYTVVILSSLKSSGVETRIFLLRYQLLRSVIFLLSCFGLGHFCLLSDISGPISVDAEMWNSL